MRRAHTLCRCVCSRELKLCFLDAVNVAAKILTVGATTSAPSSTTTKHQEQQQSTRHNNNKKATITTRTADSTQLTVRDTPRGARKAVRHNHDKQGTKNRNDITKKNWLTGSVGTVIPHTLEPCKKQKTLDSHRKKINAYKQQNMTLYKKQKNGSYKRRLYCQHSPPMDETDLAPPRASRTAFFTPDSACLKAAICSSSS